jgi:hypothetical protein
MPRKSAVNPFYVLLVIVGSAFCVTAFAYGVMTFRAAHGTAASRSADREHSLLTWIDRHGLMLLASELGLLGLFTFAAIGTDRYWSTRPAEREVACSSGHEKSEES